MKQVILSIFSLGLLAFYGCENVQQATGTVNTFTKTIPSYDAVLNDIDANVDIVIDSSATSPSYVVHAQQLVIENLDIQVKSNEMVITYKPGKHIRTTESIDIELRTPSLKSIKLLGSGNMNITGPLTADKLLCSIMGSGDVVVDNATTRKLVLEIAGSGNIKANNCTTLIGEYAIKGSGDIEAENVVTGDLKAQVTGSGDINTTVVNSLDASVTGSGSIKYKGSPKTIKKDITGSGGIEQI